MLSGGIRSWQSRRPKARDEERREQPASRSEADRPRRLSAGARAGRRRRRLRRRPCWRKAAELAAKAVLRHHKGESVVAIDRDSGDRARRPAAHGRHRRQRQHAVPVRFGAGRDHRDGRRAGPRHPSGHRRPARQEAASRTILGDGGSAQGDGRRPAQRHPCPYQRADRRRGRGARRAAGARCSARCAPPSPTGSRCWRGSTRRSPNSATRRCRSTRMPSPRRSPSSNGCATTISPSSACASSAIRAARRAARWSAPSKPGLGILADPDVLVLRRDTDGDDDDARNPRLPAWAGSADRHQGQRQVGRPPPRLSRLYRRQDLRQQGRARRRTAHRRPVHLDRLHALGDEDPLSALQGADGHREIRLRPGRPFRQGADQRAGILSARRTVPDRRADAAQARRGDPRPGRAAARAGAGAASTSSTASSRSSSSCRATATTASCARRSATI